MEFYIFKVFIKYLYFIILYCILFMAYEHILKFSQYLHLDLPPY